MSRKPKSSRATVTSLLLLSLTMTGSICLWCDRQTQARAIQAYASRKLATKIATNQSNLF